MTDIDPVDDLSLSLSASAQADVNQHLSEKKVSEILEDRLDLFPSSQVLRLSRHLISLCKKYRFDPAFILSLIQVESEFRIKAVSYAGAVGLMQLMPSTAQFVVQEVGLESSGYEVFSLDRLEDLEISPRMLFDPFLNTSIGIAYLDWLREHSKGSVFRLLAAYNVGPRRMRELLSQKNFEPVETKKYFHAVRRWVPGFRFYKRSSVPKYRPRRHPRVACANFYPMV